MINYLNQSTDSTGGSIVGWENGPEWVLRLFQLTLNFLWFKQTVQTLIRCCVFGMWSESALFANVPVQVLQITLFTQH